MTNSSIADCIVVPLKKLYNRTGNTTVVESEGDVPFKIKRVYYLYDIPGGESRGGHMHKELYQLIVAASGSFNVTIEDGKNKKLVTLKSPNEGLLIVPGIWRELFEFSSGAICLVLASDKYDSTDYVGNYEEFKKMKE